jgi:hypothetical protein
LKAPDHGDGDQGEEEVGEDVDGGVEDPNVLECDWVEALCCTKVIVSGRECAFVVTM